AAAKRPPSGIFALQGVRAAGIRTRGFRPCALFSLFRRGLELRRVPTHVERWLVEREVERVEVEPVAVADLLERSEQLRLRLGSREGHGQRLGGLDRDLPVPLEPGRSRDQL